MFAEKDFRKYINQKYDVEKKVWIFTSDIYEGLVLEYDNYEDFENEYIDIVKDFEFLKSSGQLKSCYYTKTTSKTKIYKVYL